MTIIATAIFHFWLLQPLLTSPFLRRGPVPDGGSWLPSLSYLLPFIS